MTDKKPTDSKTTDEARSAGRRLPVRSGSPLSLFDGFFEPIDRLLESFAWPGGQFAGQLGARQPVVDMQDRGSHYSITAELPGFTKDEVEVKVDGHGLELRAEKTEKESEGGAFRSSSRSFYQYLSLPTESVPQKVEGTLRNGILQLTIPKKNPGSREAVRRIDLK